MGPELHLQQAGIRLPEPPAAGGNYLPAKTVGGLVFLAGVISSGAQGVVSGTIGVERTPRTAMRPRAPVR